jgi:hypothetical protein
MTTSLKFEFLPKKWNRKEKAVHAINKYMCVYDEKPKVFSV